MSRQNIFYAVASDLRLALDVAEPQLPRISNSRVAAGLVAALSATLADIELELAGSRDLDDPQLYAETLIGALRRTLDSAFSRADQQNPGLQLARATAVRLRRRHQRERQGGAAAPSPEVLGVARELRDQLRLDLWLDRQPIDGYDPNWQMAWLATADAILGLISVGLHNQQARRRVESIDQQTTNELINEFEAPIRGMVEAGLDGLIDPDQAEFVRATIQQIALERTKLQSNPRIIELLIVGLIEEINGALEDRDRFQGEFERLGVSTATAAVVADRMSEAIRLMKQLGAEDPEADAETLDQISAVADELDEVEAAVKKGRAARLLEKAGETVAAEVAKDAYRGLRYLIQDNWTTIAHGLIIAWRAVREFIL